ncbi:hypothetical protein ALI22I_01560 [Saccharothrix sp. ALI-22-I]|uniref:hypothetical protein n=1 Tax=Saccharothrix sp. ALI-22-I TaxID=1933778 RepID=UPI00097C2970|nr:hypothetical protein [Saccharothrix sp. ALI-22-I]ONI92838.1 hypothetical protein ALI22I_01560 [Saccharothrix sp. ALI-22-I]
MGDAEQMWTTTMPLADDEADDPELVLIGIDPTTGDPGQRVVDLLLDRGHEGEEEGVFYLLPYDLGVRYERDGDRLRVLLLTSPAVFDEMVPKRGGDLVVAVAPLRAAPLVEGGVLLLRREITTDFDPATEHGDQPVVLLFQQGPAAEADLFSAVRRGAGALAIVGPWSDAVD